MIDKEVGLPIGLHFDDFVMDLKLKGHMESEAKYLDNIKELLKKMNLLNSA
jgi:hypothetical protein